MVWVGGGAGTGEENNICWLCGRSSEINSNKTGNISKQKHRLNNLYSRISVQKYIFEAFQMFLSSLRKKK